MISQMNTKDKAASNLILRMNSNAVLLKQLSVAFDKSVVKFGPLRLALAIAGKNVVLS